MVANLPYGIAATAILNTVFELPTVTRWVAMVQKEVGERFAAAAMRNGAYLHPRHNWFLSAAHTTEDINEALEVTDVAFAKVRETFGAG